MSKVVVLKLLAEGCTYAQIARRAGLTKGQVAGIAYRARKGTWIKAASDESLRERVERLRRRADQLRTRAAELEAELSSRRKAA